MRYYEFNGFQQILKVSEDSLFVHYTNWSDQFNEWIPVANPTVIIVVLNKIYLGSYSVQGKAGLDLDRVKPFGENSMEESIIERQRREEKEAFVSELKENVS